MSRLSISPARPRRKVPEITLPIGGVACTIKVDRRYAFLRVCRITRPDGQSYTVAASDFVACCDCTCNGSCRAATDCPHIRVLDAAGLIPCRDRQINRLPN